MIFEWSTGGPVTCKLICVLSWNDIASIDNDNDNDNDNVLFDHNIKFIQQIYNSL